MNRSGSREHAGIDELVERTLAHARMAREPSSDDKERVLSALRGHVVHPAAAAHDDMAHDDMTLHDMALHGESALRDDATPSDAASNDAGAVSGVREIVRDAGRSAASPGGRGLATSPRVGARPAFASGLVRSLPASLQTLVLVGAATGGLGLWLQSQPEPVVNPAPARDERPVEPKVASAEAIVAPGPLPVASPDPMSKPVPEPRRAGASAPEAASPSLASPAPALPSAPLPQRAAIRAPAAVPVPAASEAPSENSPGAPRAGDARFLSAVRLLQRAQRAVEGGTPSTALSLLDELDAGFPTAVLNEERLATRVLALCASGDVARAQRTAAELGARNPSSIYAARLAQSCAGPAPSRPGAPTTARH